jgi:hypothetical protein
MNELQKEYCVKTKLIALDWQWETLISWCQMNRLGHSSSVMHNVEGKTHKLLEILKTMSRKHTFIGSPELSSDSKTFFDLNFYQKFVNARSSLVCLYWEFAPRGPKYHYPTPPIFDHTFSFHLLWGQNPSRYLCTSFIFIFIWVIMCRKNNDPIQVILSLFLWLQCALLCLPEKPGVGL